MTTDGSCQQILNEYAIKFNAAVKNLIADLNSKQPAAGFIFTDGYHFFMMLIENPQAYGESQFPSPDRWTIKVIRSSTHIFPPATRIYIHNINTSPKLR